MASKSTSNKRRKRKDSEEKNKKKSKYTHLFCHTDFVDFIIKWEDQLKINNIKVGTNKAIVSLYSDVLHELSKNDINDLDNNIFVFDLNKYFPKNTRIEVITSVVHALNGHLKVYFKGQVEEELAEDDYIDDYIVYLIQFALEFNIQTLPETFCELIRINKGTITFNTVKKLVNLDKSKDGKIKKALTFAIIKNYEYSEEEDSYGMNYTFDEDDRDRDYHELNESSGLIDILLNVIDKLQYKIEKLEKKLKQKKEGKARSLFE